MSNRTQRRLIGVIFVAFVIVVMGVLLLVLPPQVEEPPIILEPVPPSAHPPENTTAVETIQVGHLIFNATANATGMLPHNGPITFYLNLFITITNTGLEDITDFNASKMSLYNLDSELFYTFSIRPETNATIPAGSTETLVYHNQEYHCDVPFGPWNIYARVLVTFGVNQEAIITTPLIYGLFAIE